MFGNIVNFIHSCINLSNKNATKCKSNNVIRLELIHLHMGNNLMENNSGKARAIANCIPRIRCIIKVTAVAYLPQVIAR